MASPNWDESKHPREPKGNPPGGRWKATGDCYSTAADAVIGGGRIGEAVKDVDRNDLRIVHAEVTGQGPIAGLRYGHGWVEDNAKAIVYDYSMGKALKLDRDLYYRLGHVNKAKGQFASYTLKEAAAKLLETEHYGPWDLDTKL